MNKRLHPLLTAIFWAVCLPAFPELAKLAIIPAVPTLNPTVEVLTVTFSKRGGVTLVERAEVERVMREQSLSIRNGNLVQLGQLLKADGLLVLETITRGKRQELSLRLVAVKAGVVLQQNSYPWPLEDIDHWAALAALQSEPALPKLAVLPKDAIPISILNFRSATRSAEAQCAERELTTLIQQRLLREPGVFLLERRRMDLLSEENSLFASDDAHFWGGSYLLDGMLDRDGHSPSLATLDARLVPPHGGNPIELHVDGSRTNLPALAEKLAVEVLSAFKRTPTPRPWNHVEEANQYYDEAKWAFKWGMMREAQAASEASWALGLQTKDVAELRIRSWRETGADRAGVVVNTKIALVGYGGWPDANQFADMLRAANAYEDAWSRFAARESKLDSAWFKLGILLVNDLTDWLKHYYFTPESREGQEDQITAAKEQAARLCALLLNHPDYAQADTNKDLWLAKARGSAFWVNTPEQGVTIYREMMQNGIWPQVRRRFLGCFLFQQESTERFIGGEVRQGFDLASPPLTGWTWANRSRWRPIWDQFTSELCASGNPLTSLEGRYLRCCSAWSADEFERTARELLEFVWENRASITAAGLEPALSQDLKQLVGPQSYRIKHLVPERARRMQTDAWDAFEKRASAWAQQRDALQFFSAQQGFDWMALTQWNKKDWSKAQAEELLPVVKQYKARMLSSASTMQQKQVEYWVGLIESKLDAAINPPGTNAITAHPIPQPKPTTVVTSHSPARPERVSPPRAARPPSTSIPMNAPWATVPSAIVPTNFVSGIRFWQAEPERLRLEGVTSILLTDVILREGRIWTEVHFVVDAGYGSTVYRSICGIDPAAFETVYVSIPGKNNGQHFDVFSGLGQRAFEILDGQIYALIDGEVQRHSLDTGKWESISLPQSRSARISRIGNQLFLATDESIMTLNPDGTTTLLANNRRRPPQNALDEVERYGAPSLFPGADNSIRAIIGSKVWMKSASEKEWSALCELPPDHRSIIMEDGVILTGHSGTISHLYRLLAGQQAAELLLNQPPPNANLRPGMRPPPNDAAGLSPAWSLPYGIRVVGMPACLDGTALWFYSGSIAVQSDAGRPVVKEENGSHGVLLRMPPEGNQSPALGLHLELPATLAVKNVMPRLVGLGKMGGISLRSLPQGLVLVRNLVPGFWFIPRSAINQAMITESNKPTEKGPPDKGAGTATPSEAKLQPDH